MRTPCLKAVLVTYVAAVLASIVLPTRSIHAGPIAYIGLYDSGTTTNSGICYQYSELYEQFDVWVWVLPGDDGMICTEFSIDHHDWVWVTGQTPNPENSNILGDPIYPNGAAICFTSCRTEWTWLYHVQMLTREIETGYIEIREHPDAGAYQIVDCSPGYPLHPVTILNNFGYVHVDWLDDYLRIVDVAPLDFYTLDITFGLDQWEMHTPGPWYVYNAVETTDTLVIQQRAFTGPRTATIVLGEPMTEGGMYIVRVESYCGEINDPCGGGWYIYPCDDLEYEFQFNSPVANESSSWGAIKSIGIHSEIETR